MSLYKTVKKENKMASKKEIADELMGLLNSLECGRQWVKNGRYPETVEQWITHAHAVNERISDQGSTKPAPAAKKTSFLDTIGEDLNITSISHRPNSVGGTWVDGSLNGHKFQALIFEQHAECPEYELYSSRISKLWIKRIADEKVVFNWDRGIDIHPTDKTARAIVDFLCCGLAEHTFGK